MKKIVLVNGIFLLVVCLVTVILQVQLHQKTVATVAEMKIENNRDSAEERKVVLLLGSSVTEGLGASNPQTSWAGQLHTYLSSKDEDTIFLNLGVGGYTTQDVVNSTLRITSNLNAEKLTPDVIIFENCLINDFLQLKSTESKKNITTVMQRLSEQFPHAKIYVTPPNDVIVYNNRLNSEGMRYQEYVEKVGRFIRMQDWNYVDFWDEYEQEYSEKGLTIEDTLGKDGKHPNDTGYSIWFNSLRQEIDLNNL